MTAADRTPADEKGSPSAAIRETAKWFATAFAAIGAALIAGSQLSDLGGLSSPRLGLAAVGGVLALFGVGGAILELVDVLTPERVTLTELAAGPRLQRVRQSIDANPEILRGQYASAGALKQAWDGAITDFRVARDAYSRAAPAAQGPLKVQAQAARTRLVEVDQVARDALRFASYEHLRFRFQRAINAICLAGLVAALGIGIFAWASHPPARRQRFVTPAEVSVALSDATRMLFADGAGAACRIDERSVVRAVALEERDGFWDIVTIPEAGCAPVRLSVAADSVKSSATPPAPH